MCRLIARVAGAILATEPTDNVRTLRVLKVGEKPAEPIPQAIVTAKERQVEELRLKAKELGFFIVPSTGAMELLVDKIATSMRTREGKHIYQSAAIILKNFPQELAIDLFSQAEEVQGTKVGTTTWRMPEMTTVTDVFGYIFKARRDGTCVGATRAIKKPSELFVRVLATIMPTVEVSFVKSRGGVTTLYVNFMYILIDHSGTLHAPKDANRNEIALSEATMRELRQRALEDVGELGRRGLPLSGGWWRQLGEINKAQVAEAHEQNSQGQPPPQKGKKRKAKEVFEVEAIVEEEKGWVLVRWAGYQPSWEAWRTTGAVGSPVETWEKISPMLQNTEAMIAWRAS